MTRQYSALVNDTVKQLLGAIANKSTAPEPYQTAMIQGVIWMFCSSQTLAVGNCDYTNKTRLRGLPEPLIYLVHAGGLRSCSRNFNCRGDKRNS